MEDSPSRSLRSATSPPSVSESTPGVSVAGKRKAKDSEKDNTIESISDEDDENEEESSGRKRHKVKKTDIEQTDIEFNREEKKYVIMKLRSGDGITSPCWSSKLCQVATLSKEGLALMRQAKSKFINEIWFNNLSLFNAFT
jgi:hypothetical protein